MAIRWDNGREFISSTVTEWLGEHDVEPVFIEKGSPQQDPYVERFNGTMRRDLLDLEDCDSTTEARVVIDTWNIEYNKLHPHRGLGMMTPHTFARSQCVDG